MFRNEPRPLNWRGLPTSPSSFCICPLKDTEFSSEPMIFMVFNNADADRTADGRPRKGKPPGFGMPGGGVNVGDMDTVHGAAERELEYETGLVGTVKPVPLIEEHWLLVLDKRTEALLRKIRYAKGQQPSVQVRPSEKAVLNPFYVFSAEIRWQDSRLRKFMLKCRDEFVEDRPLDKDGNLSHITKDYFAKYGLYLNDLTDEELEELDVREKEEIAGFALLPVGLLLEMSRSSEYHLDPPGNTVYVYKSHVDRILDGLEMIGMIKAVEKGADN